MISLISFKVEKEMLIPTLLSHDIPNINWSHAQQSLEKITWGKGPIILKIKHIHDENEILLFLDHLHEYLVNRGIHPKLPYPIFIQSDLVVFSPHFVIISSYYRNRYYIEKSSQAKGKENSLLNKISVLKQAILNHSLFDITDDFCRYSQKSKHLKNICLENNYYQEIINKWSI